MKYAYSTLTIKAMSDDKGKRKFTGIATTPTADKTGDIVEPLGAEFTLPIPLIWMHNSHDPVGWVTAAKVTSKGIEIEAELAQVEEPASLKDRLDTAWSMIQSKLVRGLSIGFKPLESTRINDTYSYRFMKWLWLELSPVVIPANGDASILSIKAVDQAVRTASGLNGVVHLDMSGSSRKQTPGVTGSSNRAPVRAQPTQPEDINMKTIAEQLAAFAVKRAKAMERKQELVQLTLEEGRSFDEHEKEENESLVVEIKAIDEHVKSLNEHQQFMVSQASPVPASAGTQGGPSSVDLGNHGIVSVRRNMPKGTAFTRYAMALAAGKGNLMQAERTTVELTKGPWSSTPEVAQILKAAVAAGTTSDPTWAGPLVQYNDMVSEFIELLRPMTLLGRMTGLRRVPFNIRIPRQTSGSSGAFVGEGAPTPVNSLQFDNVTLPWAKASTIVVLTLELARLSDPSAENLVRSDLLDGMSQYLDKRLIDPVYAGVANVSPASLSYGVTGQQASGATLAAIDADVRALMTLFIDAELGLTTGVWVMSPGMALRLSLMRTNQDNAAFPKLTMNGGEWYGLPVLTSNNVVASQSPGESQIFLMDQREILLADNDQMTLDVSTEASLQMNDAPSAGAQSLVSLWQNGLLGIKVDRWIYWTKRRSTALQFIEAAQRYNS